MDNPPVRKSGRNRALTNHFGCVWSVDCLLEDWIGKGGVKIDEEKYDRQKEQIRVGAVS